MSLRRGRYTVAVAGVMLAATVTGVAQGEVRVVKDADGTLRVTNRTSGEVRPTARIVQEEDGALRVVLGNGARVTPRPDRGQYDAAFLAAAGRHRLPVALLKAVARVESAFDPTAVSHAGAEGLMQLMPQTAKRMEVADPFDPEASILGGARYLRKMLDRFDDDLTLALAAYNAGPEAVTRYGDVPPFEETQRYVRRVRSHYERLIEASGAHPGT